MISIFQEKKHLEKYKLLVLHLLTFKPVRQQTQVKDLNSRELVYVSFLPPCQPHFISCLENLPFHQWLISWGVLPVSQESHWFYLQRD